MGGLAVRHACVTDSVRIIDQFSKRKLLSVFIVQYIYVSTLPLTGVNSRFFSAIPLSRFSLKMSRFFLGISSLKKCTLCALLSVKWNSDDSATSFQCSAKLIRSAKL